ncbi:MAG TPA: NUDIX domain-containing protein, partial [Pseudolysinimonas sp.]|nr:NUDIX domain-containing protein [Pseudolysinimonas sp.]
MAIRSAGILLYRTRPALEVWIAHMGGPFWARKDERAWSIPKGEFEATDADALAVARREFAEEVGVPAPDAAYRQLGEFR